MPLLEELKFRARLCIKRDLTLPKQLATTDGENVVELKKYI